MTLFVCYKSDFIICYFFREGTLIYLSVFFLHQTCNSGITYFGNSKHPQCCKCDINILSHIINCFRGYCKFPQEPLLLQTPASLYIAYSHLLAHCRIYVVLDFLGAESMQYQIINPFRRVSLIGCNSF